MAVRLSGIKTHPDDMQEMTDKVNKHYKEFRGHLREFLGLTPENDTSFVCETPAYPSKDWNEQLLSGLRMQESAEQSQEVEQEQQTRFHR